jgi:Fe-S oxidoreductase
MEAVMHRFVDSLKHQLTDEDVINLEACIDCKLCGEACAWYLGTGEDTLHPTHKTNFIRQIYKRYMTLEGKVAGSLGLMETPKVEDLRERMKYFWNCTSCGRCTLSCPVGLSTRRIVRMARAAYSDSGLSNENPTLNSIVQNLRDIGHSFGLEPAKVMARYALFLCSEGIDMPVDVQDADILFVCPSAANTKIPDYATKVMKILNATGVNYTVSSKLVETGTEADHIVVHHQLTRRILEDWENEAERLSSKKILVVECGCDTRTLYGDASEILGRPLKYPVIMFDPLVQELIDNGQLPVEKVDTSVTLHDPCHSTRLSGMADAMRDLLNSVNSNFVEMTPNREQNYCCNGGAGGMRLPENTELRRKISSIKANQIKNSGAEYVCSPCVVCILSLEDTCQTYGLAKEPGERMAIMLFEVVYDAMVKALEKRGELDRIRTPASFEGKSDEYIAQHSVAGKMSQLLHNRAMATRILEWLEQDDVVQRYAKANPAVWDQMAKFREILNSNDRVLCIPRKKPLTKPIMLEVGK